MFLFSRSLKSLLKPFQWLSWAFMHRYVGEQFIENEFKDLELECEVNSKYTFTCYAAPYYMSK